MQTLIEMLRSHDWLYPWSHDQEVWESGDIERAAMEAEAERLGRPELVEQAFEEFQAGDLEKWCAKLRRQSNSN